MNITASGHLPCPISGLATRGCGAHGLLVGCVQGLAERVGAEAGAVLNLAREDFPWNPAVPTAGGEGRAWVWAHDTPCCGGVSSPSTRCPSDHCPPACDGRETMKLRMFVRPWG